MTRGDPFGLLLAVEAGAVPQEVMRAWTHVHGGAVMMQLTQLTHGCGSACRLLVQRPAGCVAGGRIDALLGALSVVPLQLAWPTAFKLGRQGAAELMTHSVSW